MDLKQWRIKAEPADEDCASLSAAINVNPFLSKLLIQRGVTCFDTAKSFFRPSLDKLYDPFLMKDMDKAVERLTMAVENNEKILVYGDYDVDGTTSVAMTYRFLSEFYSGAGYYIPDRYTEGYGISFNGIDFAASNGFTLIIALDCGIKSIDKVDYANQKGIDFIICDHHQPGDMLPEAFAVLDPKRKDCAYPFKELSGCGVGFKLLQGYSIKHNLPLENLYPYLDLLTVSIAADIVPMVDENRIFCFHGMKRLNENPRVGLKALSKIAGFKKEMNIGNVVFGLAPRINAAGRIGHAHAAVDLLLASTEEEALLFAEKLDDKNLIRRDFDSQITKEAIEMLELASANGRANSTVLFKSDWHKGVVGIVASRCIEKYYRPTIILTESNGKATGSARSVDGFDVYEAICGCSDLLEQFGGHTHAAGLTLKLENVENFKARFEEIVSSSITPDQLIPKVDVDIEVDFGFISEKAHAILTQMGPFGPGNMTPIFMTGNVVDTGNSRIVGDNHLKLVIKQLNGTKTVEAIAFGMGNFFERIAAKESFRICYTISENTFNNITTIQLGVKDIKFENNF